MTGNASSAFEWRLTVSRSRPTRALNALTLAISVTLHAVLGAVFLPNPEWAAGQPIDPPAIDVIADTPALPTLNEAEGKPSVANRQPSPPVEPATVSPIEHEPEPAPAPQPTAEQQIPPERTLVAKPEQPQPEPHQPAARPAVPAPTVRPPRSAVSRPKAPAVTRPETTLPQSGGPPVEAPNAAPATVVTEVSPGWRAAIGAWLQSHKTYPDGARGRGEEGSATVRFTVDRQGRVLEFTIVQGTGSRDLDYAVGRMLRGARLPEFPTAMTQADVSVTVRVRYTLQP